MTSCKASATIGHMLDEAFFSSNAQALRLAKQALDILAILASHLNLHEPVTIVRHPFEWAVTRGGRTYLGSDLTDALAQLTTTLAMESEAAS